MIEKPALTAASVGRKVRHAAPAETYEERMAKPRRMLLLASYCGSDRVQCSDDHPCADCLVMCNTFMIPAPTIEAASYAGTLPGIVQGDKPLKKRLPTGWKTRLWPPTLATALHEVGR
jgi:hypothetical protein